MMHASPAVAVENGGTRSGHPVTQNCSLNHVFPPAMASKVIHVAMMATRYAEARHAIINVDIEWRRVIPGELFPARNSGTA